MGERAPKVWSSRANCDTSGQRNSRLLVWLMLEMPWLAFSGRGCLTLASWLWLFRLLFQVFEDFVKRNGLDFYPVAGDPKELMEFMVESQMFR